MYVEDHLRWYYTIAVVSNNSSNENVTCYPDMEYALRSAASQRRVFNPFWRYPDVPNVVILYQCRVKDLNDKREEYYKITKTNPHYIIVPFGETCPHGLWDLVYANTVRIVPEGGTMSLGSVDGLVFIKPKDGLQISNTNNGNQVLHTIDYCEFEKFMMFINDYRRHLREPINFEKLYYWTPDTHELCMKPIKKIVMATLLCISVVNRTDIKLYPHLLIEILKFLETFSI